MTIPKNINLFLPVTKIHYAEIPKTDPDITEITKNVDGSVSVTFEDSRNWKEFYQTVGEAEYEESEKPEDEGSLFSQRLIVNFPGNDIENQISISKLKHMPLIIKMYMPDGTSKMLGTLENPTFLNRNLKSADYVSTSAINFARVAETPAPFLT